MCRLLIAAVWLTWDDGFPCSAVGGFLEKATTAIALQRSILDRSYEYLAVNYLGRTGHAALVYIVLAGLQRGAPLMILPFISQAMAPTEYGAASMLTASSLLLTSLLAGPVEALVFRSAARSHEDDGAPPLLRVTAVYCYLLMPILLAIPAAVIALFVPSLLGVSGWIWAIELLAVGFLPAMTNFALPVVQARQNLGTFAWLALASSLLMIGSKLALILGFRLGVLGWVLSDLLSAIVSAALAMALVRPPRVSVNANDVRSVARFVIPLLPHRASTWAITSLSRPVMAIISSMAQVGLLSLGLNIASVATLFLAEINRAVMPRYSRESFPAPTQLTQKVAGFQIVLAFAAPAVVGSTLALTGHWVFAEAYWPAFALTGVLLVGQAALGIYYIPTNYLIQAAGATKPVALASGIGGIVQFATLLFFGRSYGAVGAAYATSVGFVVMAIVAAALPQILGLDIAWRTWCRCWPQALLAGGALAGSIAALTFPVGSDSGCLLALLSVASAVGALVGSRRW